MKLPEACDRNWWSRSGALSAACSVITVAETPHLCMLKLKLIVVMCCSKMSLESHPDQHAYKMPERGHQALKELFECVRAANTALAAELSTGFMRRYLIRVMVYLKNLLLS